MKNHRILFLLHLPPPIHGSSMVGKWIKESKVIHQTFQTRWINLLVSKSVQETGKFSIKKIFNSIGILIQLLKELIFNRPDKVYFALTVNGFAFYRDVIFCWMIKFFRIKIIFHLHNKGVKVSAKNSIRKKLYQHLFHQTKVILLSEYLYDDIAFFVPKKNIRICPNGIPALSSHDQNTINNESVNILFLSNLIETKGVYILLEALKKTKEKGINFTCTFVGGEGDINKKKFEEKLIECKLSDRVKYVGKKIDSDKLEIFEKANIFVLPTYYKNECFPLVIIEAMQFSLPIISCPEGGIPDLVHDNKNGYLVPQKNVHELSLAIEKLILNPELQIEMGRKGRLLYEENYTLEKFESNLLQILVED